MFSMVNTDSPGERNVHAKKPTSPEERRERARLRAERWRRAHGIGPRKPAQRPWLALGISRSTWRAKAREQAALAQAIAAHAAVLARLQWQLAELNASLDKIAQANAAMAAALN